MTIVPFGPWLPDQPPLGGGGARIANNCIPLEQSYGDLDALTASSTNAMDNEAIGGDACIDINGNGHTYTGDIAKLYVFASAAFTDKSKVGGYAVPADEHWASLCWGNQIFFANIADAVQEITLGGAIFADLITSAAKPKARHLGRVRDFLVLGNTDGSPLEVRWSGLNDPTDFDVSPTTLSGLQELPGTGAPIQRVVGGSVGLIFQERAITRMTFVGSPIKFQFDTIEEKRGALVPGGVVKFGTGAFYIAEDGFFFHDGSQSQPIGSGKINRHFFDELDEGNKHRITAAVDTEKSLIVWAYPSKSGGGVTDRLIFYNWAADRFSDADVTTQHLLNSISEGFTLEQVDTFNANLDLLGISLDSKQFLGGSVEFAAIDGANKFASFDGAPLVATLETEEVALGQSQAGRAQKAYVEAIRPIVETAVDAATIVQMRVQTRNRTDELPTLGPPLSLNQIGEARPRSRARLHRFRAEISDGFEHAQGVDVKHKVMGLRG